MRKEADEKMSLFDAIIERRNTQSLKWDFCEERLGRKDLLPMWVADMDFASPKPVLEGIIKRARHEIFGYTQVHSALNLSIINWYQKRNLWKIEECDLVHSPGVVTSICTAILAFTRPNDKILIQTPVYYPFYSCILDNDRIVSKNPLLNEQGHYEIDFLDLEQKLADGVKMMIFCSPHNPIGRVWMKEELMRVAQLCQNYGVLLVSDEIHSDLIFKGHKHIPIATLSQAVLQNSITLHSPTKTFNIAGLAESYGIIPNEALRQKFEKTLNRTGAGMLNIFGLTAALEAYTFAEDWLDELMEYLQSNLETLVSYCETHIPEIQVIKPEATYLAWLDCSSLLKKTADLQAFFRDEAKVGLSDGLVFGEEGKGFMRMNFACPNATLLEGLAAIEKAVKKIST
jgi:cysteine-S-conjugate beta-lyase